MKLQTPMLVVKDMDKSVSFYKKALGLEVIVDFGANKTLTGGLALQALESWKEFIGAHEVSFGGNDEMCIRDSQSSVSAAGGRSPGARSTPLPPAAVRRRPGWAACPRRWFAPPPPSG